MTKPVDNPTLKAQLWEVAETPTEDDLPLVRDFKQRLQQIPQATRTALEEVWQSQPRRQQDGTFGYFVTDHLWVVFSSIPEAFEDDDEGVDLKSVFSPTYFKAMQKALGMQTK